MVCCSLSLEKWNRYWLLKRPVKFWKLKGIQPLTNAISSSNHSVTETQERGYYTSSNCVSCWEAWSSSMMPVQEWEQTKEKDNKEWCQKKLRLGDDEEQVRRTGGMTRDDEGGWWGMMRDEIEDWCCIKKCKVTSRREDTTPKATVWAVECRAAWSFMLPVQEWDVLCKGGRVVSGQTNKECWCFNEEWGGPMSDSDEEVCWVWWCK